MNKAEMQQQLAQWLQQSKLVLSDHQIQLLIEYVGLLDKWNKAYNLSSIRQVDKMLTHHIMDSVALAPWVTGQAILDVGTGAGLPGIPLSIVFPEKIFCLVDSNGKKIRFLKQVIYQLGLKNVQAEQARVESLGTDRQFDVIMARAVSTVSTLVQSTTGLLASGGQYLLQKGTYPEEELQAYKGQVRVDKVPVPGLDAQRHVVIIEYKD